MRREVKWFAEKMNEKLDKKESEKDVHWKQISIFYLFFLLLNEINELYYSINYDGKEEIIDEAVDVANFAMMIADNAKQELQKDVQSKSG